ncbi:MAG TPA: ATP-grasp domain-containing protein [Fervidobacterium sp.]|jgi:carbamoyl-phosphate synthase large subunit|nr:ATP-grasp domain-containing protein [Fervidobacterium sp.]
MEEDNPNVLIPGAGGAAGIGAIKSLRLAHYSGKVISTDINPLSAGLYLADRGYIVPAADDSRFMSSIVEIIHNDDIEVILPTSGFDIVPYSQNKEELRNLGVVPVISDYSAIESCTNKLKFYSLLKNHFELPYTSPEISEINDFPCIVKPIYGKGSRNVFLCSDLHELTQITSKYDGMLVQEYLPGKEYTVDVMSDLEGHALFAIPRERIEVKSGICSKGQVVKSKELIRTSMDLVNYLGLIGPSCVQMKLDSHGLPKILEVNPRMGGATIMATYAGANFPKIVVDLVKGEDVALPTIREITVVRYYDEVVLDDDSIIGRFT